MTADRIALTFAVLALTTLAPTGCAAPAPPHRRDPVAPEVLRLEPCSLPGLDRPVRCGSLAVLEDRARGRGRTIALNVVVIPARGARRAPDPVFVIAGGPGQGAATPPVAPYVARELAAVNETRDLVLVDQRGTGRSNSLACDLGTGVRAALSGGPLAPENGFRLAECRRALERRADLRLYTTPLAMDDLDEVRAALGYDRINLFGASYGSRAALVYMRQHPERVRSVVLRAVAPMGYNIPVDGAISAQQALDRLLADCAAEAGCAAAYPRLGDALRDVPARLGAAPVPVQVPDGAAKELVDVRITGDLFAAMVYVVLLSAEYSRQLPFIVHRAHAGDFTPFVRFAVPVSQASYGLVSWGMYLSVVCAEDVPRITPERMAAVKGTFLAAAVPAIVRACADWPRGALPSGYHDPVASAAPTLLLSGELDPANAPRWGEEALRYLPNGRHVVLPGTAHGPSFPGCAGALVAQFIDAGSAAALDPGCVQALQALRRPPFHVPMNDNAGRG